MTIPSPASPPKAAIGRIRLDDQASFDLLHILDKELRLADAERRRAYEMGAEALTHEFNLYMRRIRRMIRETMRTRQEMGWDEYELSELARRS